MSDVNNKFVVVTLTKDEAKVWATGLERSSKPEKISAIDNNRHHHKLRQELRHKGPGLDPESKVFFEKLSEVPILFNTSFNLGGDPLVETIVDAIDTLQQSDIEYMYLPEIQKLVKVAN